MVLALGLDTFFYTGFTASADDNCYLLAAHNIAQGIKPLATPDTNMEMRLAFLRLALTLPTAGMYLLAEGRIFWIAFFSIIYHFCLIIIALVMGNMLHGRRVGLLAAFLTATCPLYVSLAGVVVPDLALTLWMSIALLCLIYAHRHHQRLMSSQGRLFLILAAAGFVNGLAYSTKESGLVMLAPAALFLSLAAPRPWSLQTLRNGLYFVVGLAGFLGLEALVLEQVCGQYIFRLGVIGEAKADYLRLMELAGVWPWQRAQTALASFAPYMPFSRWSLLAAMLVYPWLKNANLLPWGYSLWLILFLTFGTTGLGQYVPPPIQGRYYAPVLLPAFVFTAFCLTTLEEYLCQRPWRLPGGLARWAAGLTLGLLALVWVGDASTHLRQAGEMGRANQVRSFLKALAYAKARYPGLPIVLSPSISDRMIGMFLEDPGDLTITNRWYSVYRHPVPPPPFVLLEEKARVTKTNVLVDLPTRADQRVYEVKASEEMFPGLARDEALVQGHWLLGLNPIQAAKGEKSGYRTTLVLLVDLQQP
jgi:hypothetical protein